MDLVHWWYIPLTCVNLLATSFVAQLAHALQRTGDPNIYSSHTAVSDN